MIDSKFFPLLKRGHSNLTTKVVMIKGEPTLVCDAEGCNGGKTHSFETRSSAAKEWAVERGLISATATQ